MKTRLSTWPRQHRHALKWSAGLTLIELLLLTAVLTIMIAITAPMFRAFIAHSNIEATTHHMIGRLHYCRAAALQYKAQVYCELNFDPETSTLMTSAYLIDESRKTMPDDQQKNTPLVPGDTIAHLYFMSVTPSTNAWIFTTDGTLAEPSEIRLCVVQSGIDRHLVSVQVEPSGISYQEFKYGPC